MKRHIGTADDMTRAIGQTGTALIIKDIRASLEMDWAEEVLDADDAEEQSEEEDDKESVRIRSITFMGVDGLDVYNFSKKYVHIDAENNMQGPFFEDQMRGLLFSRILYP